MQRFYLVFFSLSICLIYNGCKKIFKDDELSLPREPYYGNAIKLDGYYYYQTNNDLTRVFFLYKNGVMFDAMSYTSINLDDVEKEMIECCDKIRSWKYSWGIFVIRGNSLEAEGWRSVGWTRKLPIYKFYYSIENDTTLCFIKEVDLSSGRETVRNEIYHFRQFSPKPDSTNNFIP